MWGAALARGGGEEGQGEVCFNKVRLRKKRKCQRYTLIQSVFVDHLLCVQLSRKYSTATSVKEKKIKITRH